MKRVFSFILSLCFVFGSCALPIAASASISEIGLYVDDYTHKTAHYAMDSYQSVKRLEEVPHTFEAWIFARRSGWRSGTILGNHGDKISGSFSFALNSNFYPELSFKNTNGAVHSAVFKNVEIPSGEWTHLAIVYDEQAQKFRCFVNGEKKGTISFADTCPTQCENGCKGIFSPAAAARYSVFLGGDQTALNPNYFRGQIQDVALYSEALAVSDIAGDFQNGVDPNNEKLILFYDIDASSRGKDIEDKSGNGYHLTYSKTWMTEEEMEAERSKKGFSGNYDYAIAVIGDPQYATRRNPEAMRKAYSWIAANKDEKNIRHAIFLGDLTDQCQPKEWQEVADALKILEDAGITYSLVRGNHDTALSGLDSKYEPTATPEAFDEIFARDGSYYLTDLLANGGLYEEGSVKNTYRTLDCEGDKWLILNLDWRVDDAVISWAGSVLEAHPDHRAIIVTHDYMNRTLSPSTNGKALWERLAGQYENVVLALGGHYSWDNINVLKSEGVHGNTVTQMLIDAQLVDYYLSGVGMVTMFYFSENGSIVDIEHYSPTRDSYYKNINQMRIDLKTERFEDEGNAQNSFWNHDLTRILLIAIPCALGTAAVAVGAYFLVKAKRKRIPDAPEAQDE